MKLKIKDILECLPALAALAKKEMPAKTSYRIGKLLRALRREHTDFQLARDECVKRYGAAVAGSPDQWAIAPENFAAYKKELADLAEEEVLLDGVVPVNYNDIAELSLAPEIFAGLELVLLNQPVE